MYLKISFNPVTAALVFTRSFRNDSNMLIWYSLISVGHWRLE